MSAPAHGLPPPPALDPPSDFDRFWATTRAALAAVAPDPRRDLVEQRGGLALERLRFQSLDGVTIVGYLLRHVDGAARPLVVHGHGYSGTVEVRWPWAQAGLDLVGLDVRGYGRSATAVAAVSPHGYVLTGVGSPETSVLRGAACDYMRAVEVGRELLRPSGTVLHGASFAGGLAVMAEAQLGVADLMALAVPSLGWTEARRRLARSGSGEEVDRYLAGRPDEPQDEVMRVLRYFDPMYHAKRVHAPAVVGIGQRDDVVPRETVEAIAARLAGPLEVMRFPVSHTLRPEEREWEAFDARWCALALKRGAGVFDS